MKPILKISLLLLLPFVAKTQQSNPDNLRTILFNASTDSVRHNACVELYFYYSEVNRDSALFYAEKRLAFAKHNNNKLAVVSALNSKGYQYTQMGNYAAAYQNFMLALRIVDESSNEEVMGWRLAQFPIPGKNKLILLSNVHHNLGGLMRNTENQRQEIVLLKKGLSIARQINHIDRQMTSNMSLAAGYIKMNLLDSALYFAKEADLFSKNPTFRGLYRGLNLSYFGDIYLKKGDKQLAKKYYYEGLSLAKEKNNQSSIATINRKLVQFFLQENEKDSTLVYALKNLEIIKSLQNETVWTNMGTANEDVYLAYKLNNQADSAYKYQGLALVAKERFYKNRIKSIADFQNLSFEESLRLENLEKEKIQTQSKIRTYGMLAGLAVLSIIGFILYRNNRQKQKANVVLQQQKDKVESTLAELKSTQSQLIQSEKMASLGELTAGIAHEIQNPLNFVNNFSEVNKELLVEMKDEMDKGNLDDAKEIANDVIANEEKINHHGKRADAIVKGMLQHSRRSTGIKEPTDINALADEYLRLAYHGLRAKDKSFNAKMITDFDETIGKISVVPQDIGRVILNLITNAIYAASLPPPDGGGFPDPAYKHEPIIWVKTSKNPPSGGRGAEVLISVRDNGPGIPQKIVDKIFQPFFTTKPTGQGTGLGLSLSYDIVKAHGGELKVETKEGEGSEFIIQIPTS